MVHKQIGPSKDKQPVLLLTLVDSEGIQMQVKAKGEKANALDRQVEQGSTYFISNLSVNERFASIGDQTLLIKEVAEQGMQGKWSQIADI